MKNPLQEDTLSSDKEGESFQMQEQHRLCHLAISMSVSTYRLGSSPGPQAQYSNSSYTSQSTSRRFHTFYSCHRLATANHTLSIARLGK